MSIIYRLLTQRCLTRRSMEVNKCFVPFHCKTTCATKVTIKSLPFKKDPHPEKDHDLRNRKIRRHLSPCLSIYASELHSFMSLSHRTSGIVAAFYVYLLGNQAILLPCDIEYYLSLVNDLHLGSGIFLVKFLFIIPFMFHYLNGIRHLIWDLAKLLEMKQIKSTGTAVIALALGASCLLLFV
ncbi:succinate dehydrogenase cytochrome b560 subunit, mitochondrial-like [Photinus pyralis]|nr:succinate dehydrogenase cytochrome b560 subunit, mitochondrial-like [Photinus pyralis]